MGVSPGERAAEDAAVTEIVNLKRARKQRDRAAAADKAAEARVRHGRTKAAKQNDTHAAERAKTALDGKRREP
jgi:hypothetical protein